MAKDPESKFSQEEKSQAGTCGETRLRSELVVGQQELEKFCISALGNSDPIIFVWATDEKPTFASENDQLQSMDEINLLFRDMIDSIFFPNGFRKKDWNLVLVSIKEEYLRQVHHSSNGIVRGWLMGADFNSQAMVNGKILVKLPSPSNI